MRNRIAAIAAALAISLPALAGPPGGPAPQFTLAARGGPQVSLAQYKGQVVMINFWASWCGPCRQEMPLLESIYKKYNKLGFTMIGVNVEPDSRACRARSSSTAPASCACCTGATSRVTRTSISTASAP